MPVSSEPQEWTAEYVQDMTEAPLPFCATVARRHNAALADERQQILNRESRWEESEKIKKLLEQQLAAEREKLESAEEDHMKYAGWAAKEIQAQIERNKALAAALERMPDLAYEVIIDHTGSVEDLPNELQCICDAALAKEGK
jgi:predicted TIM-barrel fold metal-dependent hydrolase